MGIIRKIKDAFKKNEVDVKKLDAVEDFSETRTATFSPYFVYSNSKDTIIGSIELTEDQANDLNKFMQYKGESNQDISFIRE